MKTYNRYFTIIFLCAISAQSMYPMGGTNPESKSWVSSLKNSISVLCSKALSYCSLEKAKTVINSCVTTLKNHPNILISTGITGAALGGAFWARQHHINKQNRHYKELQQLRNAGEIVSTVHWPSTLKTPNQMIYLSQKDGVKHDFIAKQLEKKSHEIISSQKGKSGIIVGLPDYDTPIKSSSIQIKKRNGQVPPSYNKLIRYPFPKDLSAPIKKIIVCNAPLRTDEMIVIQPKENLARPELYLNFRHGENGTLAPINADFEINGQYLFVKIRDPQSPENSTTSLELHLPMGAFYPFIEYTKEQEPIISEKIY